MSSAEDERGPIGQAWAGWERFWFAPADPTPLCLMRIVVGLLALYVHFAYTFDLQAFVGPDGWYGATQANRERREWPTMAPPSEWGAVERFRMPPAADQSRALRAFLENAARDAGTRQAVGRWLSSLPPDPEPRNPLVRYVQRVDGLGEFEARDEELRKMVHVKPDDADAQRNLPPFLLGASEAQREMFRADTHKFLDALPADSQARARVFNLLQAEGAQKFALVSAVIDRLGELRPAEQQSYLDYCEYWGFAPDDPDIIAHGHPFYSPFYHITDPIAIYVLHGLHLLVIALFTVGFCTRVTGVLTWLAALAYIQRNPIILFGQDTMMNLCLFYLVLSPCGETWSVDWLIARYRAGRPALRDGRRPALVGPRRLISAGFAIRLLQVQYCFMYISAGLAKLKGNSWWNGTAPFYCMTNPEFSPLHFGPFRHFLSWLCQDQNRVLWELYMNSTDLFTLALEIGLPFLVWTRLRPVMVAGAILLHFGIALNMGLVVFSLFMFTLLLAWIPPEAIRRVFGRPPEQLDKVQLRYNSDDPKQLTTAAAAAALDVWDQVEFVNRGREADVGRAEFIPSRPPGWLSVTRTFAWFVSLPGVSHVGRALDDGVAPTSATGRDESDRKRSGQKPVVSQ